MSNEKKEFTPQEAALAVLNKAQELYKNSELYKSNSAHEVDPGEEPSNEDAECPESLADQGTKFESTENKKKKKGDSSDPEHEQGMGEEQEKEHDAAENEADEMDSDNIEADEEGDAKKIIDDVANPKEDKKKPFEKSEKPMEEKPELHEEKEKYHEEAQKSDEDVAKFCKYCGSEKQMEKCGQIAPAKKNMTQGYGNEMMKEKKSSKLKGFLDNKQSKNAKVEKYLGMKEKM